MCRNLCISRHVNLSGDPIVVRNANFAWTEDTITLKDINFRVKQGSLTAIGMKYN